MNTSTSPQEEEEQEQEPARCEWDFTQCAHLSPSTPQASDALGAVEFDPSARLLATAGIARKIRIYNLPYLLSSPSPDCDFYLCTPAKLSSLAWHPTSPAPVIASADYDGVVTEYDLERRIPISERDEHGGRRVWSVHYAPAGELAASGSDDGTAHVFDSRSPGSCVHSVDARAPVCSVRFHEERTFGLALGCADKCAYVYDLRSMATPVTILSGHRKTVTYVRFVNGGRVATSSVDGRHRLWDVNSGREVRSYTGHSNARSFVGMEVCRGGGLIGCGSESNEVFVYDLRWGDPIWGHEFGPRGDGFVSAVCWREAGDDECALVAGGSNGVLQVFAGRRKAGI